MDALLAAHAPRLLALIRLRLGPSLRARTESRDLLQDCLLQAFRSLDGFEGDDARTFAAWLARIAANRIKDQAAYHARQRRDAALETSYQDGAVTPLARARSLSSRVALGEQARRIEAALETLPSDHREVIVLRRLEELGFAEIGQRMGRSPDAARMLFVRAMAALTASLGAPA